MLLPLHTNVRQCDFFARTLFCTPWPFMRSVRFTLLLRCCLLSSLSLWLAGCGDSASNTLPTAATAPPQVGTITLAPQRHTVTTELPGRTAAFLTAEIRPQVSGIVQKRLFTEGAQVKAGQVLYQIDAASYEAALAQARGQLARAQASLAAAQTTATRNAALVLQNAISQQAHDDSQTALAQAKAEVEIATAAVQAARIHLEHTRVKSPIAGRVATSSVTVGALVTANQATALTTVTQIDPLYIDITQSAAEVLQLKQDWAAGRYAREKEGDSARITLKLDDGSPWPHPAHLQFTGVQVNPNTGAVLLRAQVSNPDGLLLPGMYVRAVLQAGVNETALLVPQQAVTRDAAGNASVLLLAEGNVLERQRITTGAAVDNRWEVLEGLAAGDRIVLDGVQRVKVGQEVQAVEWQAAATTP